MASPARELLALPDEILAEVLIRLPTLADLGRSCVACPAFRRVITRHSFLRRLRALRPPPLIGIPGVLHAPVIRAQPPHPCAAVARAFTDADAVDFWCTFVPSPDRWRFRDFCDGRTLVSAVPEGSSARHSSTRSDKYDPRGLVREFAVCDPVHRRYLLLPAIPDDLAASVHQEDFVEFEPFLDPSDEDQDGTSFRVICLAQCVTKLVVFSFSSRGGQWDAVAFDDWSTLTSGPGNPAPGFQSELACRCYAHGRFCWVMLWRNKLLMLNARTVEFSSVDITPIRPPPFRAVVEAAEGKIGMFTLCVEFEYGAYYLLYEILQNDGQGATQWQSEAIIPLPLDYRYTIMGVAGGYLLLQGIPEDLDSSPSSEKPNLDCFSLNLETLQLEWFCEIKIMIIGAQLYAGFPPSLSAPTI
ncbi:hypothetical protein ACP70R_004527 [Stipagrostis hirtigluma subsp. patula]